VTAVAAASLLGGCMRGQIIDHEGRAIALITPKSQWKLSGDFTDAAKAADDNVNTVATSSDSPTSYLQIDLGKPCVFNLIIIDHGPDNQHNFPGRLVVMTSYDGKNWTTEYVVHGTRRITYIPLVGAKLARYVRLVTQVRGEQPWTVGEIYFQ